MMRLRLSRRQQAALAVALALFMWIPQGISHGDHTVITGHSTFYNGDAYDPCLGSIAGIMRSRVMWFNNQVLVERYGSEGTFIYVTEAGAADPRPAKLYSDGVFYDFVDPNGAHWHVDELYYEPSIDADVGVKAKDDGTGPAGSPNVTVKRAGIGQERTMVWVVELSSRPIYDQYAGADPHSYYNFLTLVDTCKMHRTEGTVGPEENHTLASGKLNDQNGHENGAREHKHETFFVDLWVGKRPVFALGGVAPDGAQWQSQWAAESGVQEVNETRDEGETEMEEGFEDVLP